jgi:DNA-binding MarR family transcriptional regulator
MPNRESLWVPHEYRETVETVETVPDASGYSIVPLAAYGIAAFLSPPAPLALVPQQLKILQALQQVAPRTLSQEALAGATDLSEKTIRRWLQTLEKAGLVHRPHGPRKGYAITPEGATLLARVGT